MPFRFTPSSSAFIPMVVLMQVPSAVATKSVGENASPLPLLSVGASVASFACEGPWVASQWRSPVYLIEILTMQKYLPLICHVERSRDIFKYLEEYALHKGERHHFGLSASFLAYFDDATADASEISNRWITSSSSLYL